MSYNNRTLFDVYFKKYGGRLEIERFSKDYVLGYPYIRPRKKINNFLKKIEVLPEFEFLKDNLLFDYIFNEKSDGISIIADNYYLFGVTFGFVDTIQYAINSLFRCPDFFPEIGNSSKEDLSLEKLNSNIFKIDALKYQEEENISYHFKGFHPPKDINRVIAARIISEYATSIILVHELSHIICGHLDLEDSMHKKVEFNERNILFKEDYTLEFDADFMSFQILLLGNILFEEYLPEDYLKEKQAAKRSLNYDYYSSELELQKYFSIATSLVFLLVSQTAENYYTWNKSNHPHPMCRIFALNQLVERMSDSEDISQMDSDFYDRWIRNCFRTIGFWGNAHLPGYEMILKMDGAEIVKLDESVHKILYWINHDAKSPKHQIEKTEMRKVAQSIFEYLMGC